MKRVKHKTIKSDVYAFHSNRLDVWARWDKDSWAVTFDREMHHEDERDILHWQSFMMYIRKEIGKIRRGG